MVKRHPMFGLIAKQTAELAEKHIKYCEYNNLYVFQSARQFNSNGDTADSQAVCRPLKLPSDPNLGSHTPGLGVHHTAHASYHYRHLNSQ